MVHEVMVLDHGGVDLGLIQYAAALKLWVFSAILVGVALPWRTGAAIPDLLLGVGEVFGTAVLVGAVESSMARLRLVRVPDLLLTAAVLAAVAFLWAWR
jgi:formate hydrogenlyase subunit 4